MTAIEDLPPELADRRLKKKLLLQAIKARSVFSEHDLVQKFHDAVHNSDGAFKLKAKYISGGYTNYSYRVYIDGLPELCMFAKLTFERAIWAEDDDDDDVGPGSARCDLRRTQNEYAVMEAASRRAPDCVVAPLACWDLNHGGQEIKLLLTEWSDADEQLSNQFMDGEVDPRLAPQIADTFASLHSIRDFHSNYADLVKPWMENMLTGMIHMKNVALLASQKTDTPVRRTDAYCASLGEELVMKIINANIADHLERECLIHGDAHSFNVLVEEKPSIEKLESFGPNGTVTLVDWEMAMVGPRGRDVGVSLAYPVGCAIAHSLNGHPEANESIEKFIDDLLDTYCKRMEEDGTSPTKMATVVRRIVGWCGWFQYFAFFILDVFPFPVELEASATRLRDALGVLGLKMLRLSYDTNYVGANASVRDIRKIFDALREEEVKRADDVFVAGRTRRQPRKSSIFRAAARRYSDAEVFYLAAETFKRISVNSDISDSVRASVKRLSAASDGAETFSRVVKRLSVTNDIGDSLREMRRMSGVEDMAESIRKMGIENESASGSGYSRHSSGSGHGKRSSASYPADTRISDGNRTVASMQARLSIVKNIVIAEGEKLADEGELSDDDLSDSGHPVPVLKTRGSLFSAQFRGLGVS